MEYHIESTKTNAGTRKIPMTEDVPNVPGDSGGQTNRSSGGYGKWLCWISFPR